MIMDRIGIKLNEIASRFVAFSLAEAETRTYPYAVYSVDTTPVYTKDGISHYAATVEVTVYSKDLDQVDSLASKINEAVMTEMRLPPFSSWLNSSSPDCVEGIWSRKLSYTIKQR